ncbi:ABC transporter permease [Mangrovihabitans endophyticus]|uniref:ABC transporter permease n=1 Tax=Mangrovihabitans endophyticus TaxID=1751298 RepID=A0A8J3C3D1_9ACTN|nr:ABC transporter permease [Mangrovihabitans endophyticus]GGL04093.1 ABC transporter permease [Mangrovihabitans endophyticus]
MRLAWQTVRHRRAAFAGTFVAIAAGVALVSGAGSLAASSRPQAPDRYDASTVAVHSPSVGQDEYGNPEYRSWTTPEAVRIASGLRAVPGVRAAVADPVFYVQRIAAGRPAGDAEASLRDGHSWPAAALGGYRLTAGRPPVRRGEVVAGDPACQGAEPCHGGASPGDLVVPGETVRVLTADGPQTWTVTGTADGPGWYVPADDALRRSSGVRVIGLLVDGDPAAVAQSVRRVVGDRGTVLAGSDRGALEPDAVSRVRWLGAQLLIAMVSLSVFVTVFVVAATCGLGAAQRRRETGLLRAVGATPGQVRRTMVAETLVVGAAAGLTGVPAGALAAPLLAGPLVRAGLEPAGFTVTAQPVAWAAAYILGVVVALAGAVVAAWRSSRVPPLEALRETAAERRAMTPARWLAGVLGAVGGTVLLALLPRVPLTQRTTAGTGAAMLLIGAAALLAPVLIGPLVRAVTWPVRRSATALLVREGTRTAARRTAATAAPALLAVAFTVLLTGMVATIEGVEGTDRAADIPAALVLAPDGAPGLAAAAVRGQPGRSALPTRVLVGHGGATEGLDAAGVDGPDRGAVLTPATAARLGLRRGDDVRLWWADGTAARVPVRAVTRDAPAGLCLPRALVREHDPVALTPVVLLDGAPVPATGARTMSARAYVQIDIDAEGRLVRLFLWVLLGLTAGYAVLAVANTMAMSTAGRRAEFRTLRLAGAAAGQAKLVAVAEALLAVVAGTLLGAVVAAVALTGVRDAVAAELQRAVPLVVPWGAASLVALVCAVAATLASVTPRLVRAETAGSGR